MKKIINLFKASPIAMVIAGLLIAGVAGAALVPYLSNTAQVNIEVKSPMVVAISEGEDTWATEQCSRPAGCPAPADWSNDHPGLNCSEYPGADVDCFPESDANSDVWSDTISIGDTYGGESVTLYVMSKNVANAEIKGYEEFIVENPDGVACKDFASIKSRYDSIYGDLGYGTEHTWTPEDDGCSDVDGTHIKFGSTESTWGVGETDVSEMVVTFKLNAFGTYTFSYRVIPAQ